MDVSGPMQCGVLAAMLRNSLPADLDAAGVQVVCDGLQAPNASLATCPLGGRFFVQSDAEELQSGRFRAYVQMETWCAPPLATLPRAHDG